MKCEQTERTRVGESEVYGSRFRRGRQGFGCRPFRPFRLPRSEAGIRGLGIVPVDFDRVQIRVADELRAVPLGRQDERPLLGDALAAGTMAPCNRDPSSAWSASRSADPVLSS